MFQSPAIKLLTILRFHAKDLAKIFMSSVPAIKFPINS